MTDCPESTIAYLIKDTATPGTPLGNVLQDIDFTGRPGYMSIDAFGLDGIQKRMKEAFAPNELMSVRETRNDFEQCHRKFKEKPLMFFRRLEIAEQAARARDDGYQPSDRQRAVQ